MLRSSRPAQIGFPGFGGNREELGEGKEYIKIHCMNFSKDKDIKDEIDCVLKSEKSNNCSHTMYQNAFPRARV